MNARGTYDPLLRGERPTGVRLAPVHRDRVLARLTANGIGAGVHYPIPLHLQGAFADLGYRPGDFPVGERAAGELVSLPLFPHLTTEQQSRVAAALRAALEEA